MVNGFNSIFVQVTNCFTVPHHETQEEVAFDKEYANSMLDLYREANPSEDIVGWFGTSNEVSGHSTLIHEYYSIECENPIHLTIDCQLKSGRMDFKTYVPILSVRSRRKKILDRPPVVISKSCCITLS